MNFGDVKDDSQGGEYDPYVLPSAVRVAPRSLVTSDRSSKSFRMLRSRHSRRA